MYRVLKPNGEIFMTVPFRVEEKQTKRRASIENGEIQHLLPPIYHSNPLSKKGSFSTTLKVTKILLYIQSANLQSRDLASFAFIF